MFSSPQTSSGENSRRKLQNVVTNSTAVPLGSNVFDTFHARIRREKLSMTACRYRFADKIVVQSVSESKTS